MGKRIIGGVPVNDGKGLFDSEGLCDSLIIDCNNSVKALASGQYVGFCNIVVQMVQKLTQLKTGIKNELSAKDATIEELKRENDNLFEQATGIPVDKTEIKDGDAHGAE